MSDTALVNSLPEYPQAGTSRSTSTNIFMQPKRNPNLAKWNILFDRNNTEWISFKPKLGLQVYPCYACRNMFGSKNSFLDHVNRRAMLLRFKCIFCTQQDQWTFYNPCSFLLHTRQHYTLLGGQINLDYLEVCVLPYGLAGFLPNPSISILYDVEDDNIGEASFINSRFYSPINECMGNHIINLIPNELLFYYADEITKDATSLILRQLSSNIPRCQFISLDNNRFTPIPNGLDINGRIVELGNSFIVVKEEPWDPVPTTPIIIPTEVPVLSTIVEPVEEPVVASRASLDFTKCPECHQAQNTTMSEHFLKTNQPFLESLRCTVCKYIAPTKCSLEAHTRIHCCVAPYVCPECGRDFQHWQKLHEHMNEVCFHLTKQVRIRCSGKRCGKIFAQMSTFATHFLGHVKCWLKCTTCGNIYYNELEFLEHSSAHELKQLPMKVFKCLACIDSDEVFTQDALQLHIQQHAVSKFLYVYICKSCHSYFRSPLTYATHLLRCTKLISPQVNPNLLAHQVLMSQPKAHKVYTCLSCNTSTSLKHLKISPFCPNCNSPAHLTNINRDDSSSENDLAFCPLCDKELSFNDIEEHTENQCKYSKPIVALKNCQSEMTKTKHKVFSPRFNDGNIQKKRRKSMSYKNKSMFPSNSEPDLSIDIDEIIPFDGTYRCKLCEFTNEVRQEFHNHIIQHRSIATAYQCMECGECFVVKPSLSKHLLYFHQINDIEQYFKQNNCFDKQAMKEMEYMMHLVPGESKRPVGENQCTVCSREFSNNIDLKQHFRYHGMAFILKNYTRF